MSFVKNSSQMNWRKNLDLYNAPLFVTAVGSYGGKVCQIHQAVKWNCFAVIWNDFKIVLNIDWRGKIDLYNAHLFDATVSTAKAEKFFKIQIKQPISVGMWAGEFNR